MSAGATGQVNVIRWLSPSSSDLVIGTTGGTSTLSSDQMCPTLELKVSFIRPVRQGVITGTGRVVHRGGSVAFLEGQLHDSENQLVATATATARILKFQRA